MTKSHSFDDNVNRYEFWFERNRPAYESEIEAIRALFQRSKKGLEIGVGTGRFAVPLGLRFGIDPAKKMGRVAVKRGVEVILGVGENLPCKEGRLDTVLMVTTICFLDDIQAALKEAYRVLGKGGNILVGFIDRGSPLGKIYETHRKDNVFYKNASFLSADEVVSHLKQAGFRNLLLRQTIFGNPADMKKRDPVKTGCGEGSFVVVRAKKACQQEGGVRVC